MTVGVHDGRDAFGILASAARQGVYTVYTLRPGLTIEVEVPLAYGDFE